MRYSLTAARLLIVLSIAGCTLFPESKPLDVWTLEPATVSSEAAEARVQGLRVMRPRAGDLLNSNRMAVAPEGESISVYKGARWSDPVPRLLRDYLLDALQRDPRFSEVSGDDVQLAAKHELVSRLDAFHIDYRNGRPEAVVRMHVQLVAMPGRDIVAERLFSLEETSNSEDMNAIVMAFSGVLAQLYKEISKWILDSLAG
ncbi:MAG: membrane integrity-associated transporter subunit PqiC [Oleiphilaceae bacterium]|nr:membrane integrity-associated transporter subunit PqiC [Oleiphilaceae bacterium]